MALVYWLLCCVDGVCTGVDEMTRKHKHLAIIGGVLAVLYGLPWIIFFVIAYMKSMGQGDVTG